MATHTFARDRVISKTRYEKKDGHYGLVRGPGGKYLVDRHALTVLITVDEDALATFLAARCFRSKTGVSKVQGGIIVAKIIKRSPPTTAEED